MRRPKDIAVDRAGMQTIEMLTNAFEGLASMRISQIKDQVEQSQRFFEELWNMYSQIRVDNLFRFGRHRSDDMIRKQLYIAITAEGGFSGDIDQRLIRQMLDTYNPDKQDIVIIGHHGAVQLQQAGIKYKKYFKLPMQDHDINVTPLVKEVRQYESAVVYYQTYESLMNQSIKRIDLSEAVKIAGQGVVKRGDVITESNYIFEPSNFAVAAHLERSIVDITLSQVILTSKLAQYASRFRAMRMANDKASDEGAALDLAYNRAKRSISDERLKEIINGLKKTRMANV